MKRIGYFLLVIFSIFLFSCSNSVTCNCETPTITVNIDDNLDIQELSKALKEDMSSFNFLYDVDKDTLYSVCGDYKVVLLIDDIKIDDIHENKVAIPYTIVKQNRRGEGTLLSDIATYDFSKVNRSSFLLSFDDSYLSNWRKHLSLFTDNNLKATFFVYGEPANIKGFCKIVQEAKLEVGYHTLTHKKNLEDFCDEEHLKTEALDPAIELHKNYIYANSFALPNGAWVPYVIEELLKYYKIVRFYGNFFRLYKPEEIGEIRAIHSCAIDNNRFADDEAFKNVLFKRLLLARITETVFPCTTHNIVDSFDELDDSRYAITTERLMYIVSCLEKINVKSSLYKNYYDYIY